MESSVCAQVAKVFQESQGSVAGHRKQIILLKRIQQRAFEAGNEDEFNEVFCKLVNKVLVVKRTENVGDRIVKLVASFILSLQEDYKKKDSEDEDEEMNDEDEENMLSRFVNHFIRHLLKGIESKDKNVRYRVVQFLDFTMSGLGEIDDGLYEELMFHLDKRLHDKEASIRIKALHCISRFQEEDENDQDEENNEVDESTGKLLVAIQNDPSAEVRRAALLNLVKTKVTKHYLLERARDTNAINRRLVYSRIIKEFGDFRTIEFRTREKLLSWGLKDREESVKKSCIQMFSINWLNTIDGDLIELLERLHVTKSEVCELAMDHFFENRRDLINKISFPESIWLKLTPEISFLAKKFYYYCYKNSLNDLIDLNFPEAAELANLLSKYLEILKSINKNEESEESEEIEEIEFIIEQILVIAINYDFSDEIGRRAMLQIIRNSITLDNLNEKLIENSLKVLRKLSINERDFCSMINEIINDIYDENQDEDETNIQCLIIVKHMLELVNEGLNISINSLIESLINPAVRNTKNIIRELGTYCLGLCCLLDLELSINQLYLFGLCLSKGHEELRVISIKILFDILSIFGTKVLDVEDGVDSLSLHKLFYRTLKSNDLPVIQSIAAEGLCKLYLCDILSDDELFETLILSYYNPINSSNENMIQAFTFCLPVYCFSHIMHQERMSRVAADAFKRLFIAHVEEINEDGEKLISPGLILQQLIYWTDINNVVNIHRDDIEKNEHHVNFIIKLIETFDEVDNKKYRKTVLTNLMKFSIPKGVPQEKMDELRLVIDSIETDDNVCKNVINKFKSSINI